MVLKKIEAAGDMTPIEIMTACQRPSEPLRNERVALVESAGVASASGVGIAVMVCVLLDESSEGGGRTGRRAGETAPQGCATKSACADSMDEAPLPLG